MITCVPMPRPQDILSYILAMLNVNPNRYICTHKYTNIPNNLTLNTFPQIKLYVCHLHRENSFKLFLLLEKVWRKIVFNMKIYVKFSYLKWQKMSFEITFFVAHFCYLNFKRFTRFHLYVEFVWECLWRSYAQYLSDEASLRCWN